jgi:hypothetical protein
MGWQDLKQGLRVRATSGIMQDRVGVIDDVFPELQPRDGTREMAAVVRFDEPPNPRRRRNAPIRLGVRAESIEEENQMIKVKGMVRWLEAEPWPKCPHCLNAEDESAKLPEYRDGDADEVECSWCGGSYEIHAHAKPTFDCRPKGATP